MSAQLGLVCECVQGTPLFFSFVEEKTQQPISNCFCESGPKWLTNPSSRRIFEPEKFVRPKRSQTDKNNYQPTMTMFKPGMVLERRMFERRMFERRLFERRMFERRIFERRMFERQMFWNRGLFRVQPEMNSERGVFPTKMI